MNEQWKNAYKEGFADGYAAAKKEMNYTNFPPVYYNPVMGTPVATDPRAVTSSIRATGYPPVNNGQFVSGMSLSGSDC